MSELTKTQLFFHKYLPHLLYKKPDGGSNSGVRAYMFEWKKVFSIGLLHFKDGSRESYHNHAFNALSWFIKGRVTEEKLDGSKKDFSASIIPKFTPRTNCHRVISHGSTWCFTIRGPWKDSWEEVKNNKSVMLTHGRKEISSEIPTN